MPSRSGPSSASAATGGCEQFRWQILQASQGIGHFAIVNSTSTTDTRYSSTEVPVDIQGFIAAFNAYDPHVVVYGIVNYGPAFIFASPGSLVFVVHCSN